MLCGLEASARSIQPPARPYLSILWYQWTFITFKENLHFWIHIGTIVALPLKSSESIYYWRFLHRCTCLYHLTVHRFFISISVKYIRHLDLLSVYLLFLFVAIFITTQHIFLLNRLPLILSFHINTHFYLFCSRLSLSSFCSVIVNSIKRCPLSPMKWSIIIITCSPSSSKLIKNLKIISSSGRGLR